MQHISRPKQNLNTESLKSLRVAFKTKAYSSKERDKGARQINIAFENCQAC